MRYRKADEIVVDGTSVRNTIGCGLLALAIVGGVGYGGYELYWAASSNSAQKASQINRESLGFQQAKVDEINNDLTSVAQLDSAIAEGNTAVTGQRLAIAHQICADYNQLTPAYVGAISDVQQRQVASLCNPTTQNEPLPQQ